MFKFFIDNPKHCVVALIFACVITSVSVNEIWIVTALYLLISFFAGPVIAAFCAPLKIEEPDNYPIVKMTFIPITYVLPLIGILTMIALVVSDGAETVHTISEVGKNTGIQSTSLDKTILQICLMFRYSGERNDSDLYDAMATASVLIVFVVFYFS